MSALKDLSGMKFGRLTVLERAGTQNGHATWHCRCECGNECVVYGGDLKSGHTASCGCLHLIHGMTDSKIYKTWHNIKNRCFNPNSKDYEGYGGRGVTVYDEWRDNFLTFFSYVSQLPHYGESGYTLDRKDNDGNYEPGNVRWLTAKEQARNRRNNTIIEYQGQQMTLAEAAEKSGIAWNTLSERYKRGDRGERLFRPVRGK